MTTRQWSLIGRGKVGWHASGLTDSGYQTSSSGGQLDDYTYWTGEHCAGYAAEAIDGAFVYDAENADYDAFSHFVCAGPMYDPRLEPLEWSGLLDGDRPAGEILPDALVTLDDCKVIGIGGLSSVGIGIYEKLLRNVPGVRFGRVIDGQCVWEDELTFVWEVDSDGCIGCDCGSNDCACYRSKGAITDYHTPEVVALYSTFEDGGRVLASLGSVCDPSLDYRVTIERELLAEAGFAELSRHWTLAGVRYGSRVMHS